MSSAVVSYVLNNGPRPVSEKARAKVLAAVDELGYQRDGVARMLALGRSSTLGLVVPDIALPYYGRVTQKISSHASERGLQLLVGTSDWDVTKEQAELRALIERRVDGLIVMSVDPRQDFSAYTSLGTPIAVIDRPEFGLDGSALITQHLIDHGHRYVSLLSAPLDHVVNRRRRDGWRRALVEAGLDADDGQVQEADPSPADGHAAIDAILAATPQPTAVVVTSDGQALGVLRRLHERGLAVPENLAIATLDASDVAPYTAPALTSLTRPTTNIADAAITALLADDAEGVQRINVVDHALAIRESCGCGTAAQPHAHRS